MKLLKQLFKRVSQRDTPFTVPVDKNAPWQSEARGELAPINRTVLVVLPKQPYVDWVRKMDERPTYSLAESRRNDYVTYLIPSITWEDETGTYWEDAGAIDFIGQFWNHFFAQSLAARELQPDTWPKDRTLVMFQHWFDIEVYELPLDLGVYEK